MSKLKIYNKDQSFLSEISVDHKEDILKQILDNNVKIFYGCMGGSCGACACSIISGEEYIVKEAKKNAVFKRLNPGEFLPCIAKISEDTDENQVIEIRKRL